jgi:capsular exopolysaccharide synthesis family protein
MMNQADMNTTTKLNNSGGSNFLNTKKVFMMMLRNWYFYLIGLVLAGAGAYLFLKHKIPSFSVETMILIGQDDPAPGQDMLEGFSLRPGVQNLDNQITIVASYSVIRKAVEELPFEVDVYRKGLMSEASYYPMSPLRIEAGTEGWPFNSEFVFKYDENDRFHLKSNSKSGPGLDTLMSFGQTVRYQGGSFIIKPQPELEDIYKSGDRIYIRFYDKEHLTERYMKRLMVENTSRDGSILKLSLEGTNKVKDVIFLNKLTEVYIYDNLDKKNFEAKRIIEFIDAQLVDVTDSLLLTENQLQDFRSRNRIMDVSAQAQQIIDQAVLLENARAQLTLEGNYYKYLENYLSSEDNEKAPVAPASMGIEDPLLANLLQELAALQAEYFSNAVGDRNPLQAQLELRIKNTKQSIAQTLSGHRLANTMAMEENQRQLNKVNAEASGLPIKERQLLGFERKFNLNNVLYTFLLTRRAEAQIQSASNAPDNELIDKARARAQVAPNQMLVILIALTLALGIPTMTIIFKELMHNRITNEEDLKMVTNLPVVANFPHSRLSYNTVVLTEPSSKISEAFRSLRTHMGFFTQDIECPMILVTSSVSGEGKTFAAINLASAYSLTGKSVVLIGFDLRRPSLSKSFKLDGEWGITSYLIGKKTIDEVIYKTDYDNLHIIPSGPIPPNPGELSGLEKVKEMVKYLKGKYDYIIIDSPPIGVVSDIYTIASVADAILMMVRHDYTKKNVLASTLVEMQTIGIKSPSILVNDVKSRGQSYRYAYKYKYDYSQTDSKKSIAKIFKKKDKTEVS